MRFGWKVAVLVLAGCSPPPPQIGTWRFETVSATVTTLAGSETKTGTFEIDLAASAVSDLAVWRLGGCNVPVAITGQVAEQSTVAPLCGVTPGAKLPMLDAVMPKADDQLEVKSARFEVLTDGKLKARFELKLYTDLKDARVGHTVLVDTVDGKHGTKAK